MAILLQSTAYTRMFKMISSADHISLKTGLACTVNLSKAGAGFGAAGGTVSEVADGWYKVALTTTDTGTLGDLAYYITGSSGAAADDTDFCDQITAAVGQTGDSYAIVKSGGTGDAAAILTTTNKLGFDASSNVKASLASILGTALTETAGQLAAAFKQFFNIASPTSTINTITTVTTATNLTNAPTAGDLTATMKASVTAAVPTAATIQSGLATPTNITAGIITTVTNLTNAPTNGDLTATMKASVTSAVPTVAAIQSGLATPTNITAGVITTVTNLTNAPTSGDLTAAMKTSVTTAATAATPTIAGYTGDTPQTGDSFARIGAAGAGLTALGDTRVANLDAAVSTRSVYAGGAVASVTGNVGGNVAGSVASVTGNVGGNVAGSVNSVVSPVTLSDVPGILKNSALNNFVFLMVSSTDHITGATGLTITAQRSIDGGVFGACTNSATEIGSGLYKINLSAADLNGTIITLMFTSAGADARIFTIKTNV